HLDRRARAALGIALADPRDVILGDEHFAAGQQLAVHRALEAGHFPAHLAVAAALPDPAHAVADVGIELGDGEQAELALGAAATCSRVPTLPSTTAAAPRREGSGSSRASTSIEWTLTSRTLSIVRALTTSSSIASSSANGT